jgi:hypothetical protein
MRFAAGTPSANRAICLPHAKSSSPRVAANNAEVNWRATQDKTANTYVIEIAI